MVENRDEAAVDTTVETLKEVVGHDAAVTWKGPSRAASAAVESSCRVPEDKKRVDDFDVDCNLIGCCKTAAALLLLSAPMVVASNCTAASVDTPSLSMLEAAAVVDHFEVARSRKARERRRQ